MAFGKRRKRGRSSTLNLAPLIDINANLLFFMMINAAVQEDRLEAGQRVELPESNSTKAEAGDLISIVVGKEHISINEIEIMKLDGNGGFFADDIVEGQERIKPLYKDLTERFQNLIRKGAQPGAADDKLPVILVQADKGLPYSTVKTVMRTCGQAGFTKFRFAAKQG
jgi:biopolymer transport protein ExbD